MQKGSTVSQWMCSLAIVLVLVAGNAMASSNQTNPAPAARDEHASGRATYLQFCSSCHGVEGRGDGPVVKYLLKRPDDLKLIRKQRKGVFPKEVYRAILMAPSRDHAPAEMSTQMMIWGPVFQMIEGNPHDAQARVDQLLDFLESIQQK